MSCYCIIIFTSQFIFPPRPIFFCIEEMYRPERQGKNATNEEQIPIIVVTTDYEPILCKHQKP